MFSLIITIISIALVAVLALATLYYGGDAFNRGSAGAEAARLINEGQQVNAAVTMAGVDEATLSDIDALVTGKYLAQVPGKFLGDASVTGADVTATGVPDNVCIEVQFKVTGTKPADMAAVGATKQLGQLYGCYGAGSNNNTFFYNL